MSRDGAVSAPPLSPGHAQLAPLTDELGRRGQQRRRAAKRLSVLSLNATEALQDVSFHVPQGWAGMGVEQLVTASIPPSPSDSMLSGITAIQNSRSEMLLQVRVCVCAETDLYPPRYRACRIVTGTCWRRHSRAHQQLRHR
jgi:hypothetical protein